MASKGPKKFGSAPSSADSSPAQSRTILDLMGKETSKDPTKEQSNKDMDIIMAMFLELKAEIKSNQQKIEERIDKLHDKIEETVKNLEIQVRDLNQHLTESKQDILKNSNKIDELDKHSNVIEEKLNQQIKLNTELQETISEYSDSILKTEMEKSAHMFRLRGVEETKDLLDIIIHPLAERIGLEAKELEKEIEYIHRTNSRFAKINKLPRDVRVTFVRREMKERVMKTMNEKPLMILGKEVVILKKTPRPIREMRKNHRSLTEQLNKDNIRFRWLFPEGIIVNWRAKNVRLETPQEAREFYKQSFKEIERDQVTEVDEDKIGTSGSKNQRQYYKKLEINPDQEARTESESQINTRKKKRI
ncbi:hypothetical protein JRQ81_012437 [Phrynocephalus forsythii]|uniref:L1 transposable element RRM domain-containing protein n=1 Tax=Phrynocephalus forsythii TaxID=171643 RepID=A0A9Q0Y3T2_9SAUR|nr:hypothetical protein JRQ81_012437 [Phrynocephalus forsythii]